MNDPRQSPDGFLRRTLARFIPRGQLLDPKFRANPARYVFQCLLVCLTMLGVLTFLDAVYQTVLIAALGASSVIAFSAPSMRASRPRSLIGGYLIGILVGCVMSSLTGLAKDSNMVDPHSLAIVLGAIAVGAAMFLMATTDTEHPPGAAIALGFVLNEWDMLTVVVVIVGIVLISLVKEFARNWLIDLL
jgi:CBS-domain-containing membrane protein